MCKVCSDIELRKLGRPVLAPSGLSGAYDEMAVDCPFIFFHQNRYHMLHVGFDGKGYQTALVSSGDLLRWEEPRILFPRGEAGQTWDSGGIAGVWILRDNNLFEQPRLKKYKGRYWMVYHSYPGEGYEAGSACIGLAWTDREDLSGWRRLPDPILSWKDGADWEMGGLYKGCLVEHEGRFYLFYNAKDRDIWPWREQIGLAVSEDLLHWTRCETNPILRVAETPGAWDSQFVSDPFVVWDGNAWRMYYYGYDGIHAGDGIARSGNLYNWEKDPLPLLTHGKPGEIDSRHAHKPCVVWDERGRRLYHFYCAVRESHSDDPARRREWDEEAGEERSEYRCITFAYMGD